MTHVFQQHTANFLGLPDWTNEPIAILGAPWDGGTTSRSGTRLAPSAIRSSSLALTDGSHERWPVAMAKWAGDAGNVALPTGDTDLMLSTLERAHTALLGDRERNVVTLGGDHTITLACLRSLRRRYGRPLALVHLDAHSDAWPTHEGELMGHGVWVRAAVEEGLILPQHAISMGIRGPHPVEVRHWLRDQGGTTITAGQAMNTMPEVLACQVRSSLGPGGPVYLSLDIDVLDPAHAPGTGTPEIGGVSTLWLSQLLDCLSHVNWCGMDLVEVCPPYDTSGITSLAAATLVWQYVCMLIHKNTP